MSDAVFIPARKEDWDWARVQYERSDKRVTDIATEIGVTPTNLLARATRGKWTRNIGQAIVEARAEHILAAEQQRRVKLEVIERVNAQMQSEVLKTHRKDINRARNICTELFQDLSQNVDGLDLDQRSKVLTRLSDSMKSLLLLERQAYGIVGVFEDLDDPSARQSKPVEPDVSQAILTKFAAAVAKHMGAVEVVENVPSTKRDS